MRTFITAASLLPALSPWILPAIAAAAKLTHEGARNACRGEFPQNRSGDRGNARTDGQARNQQSRHASIAAKLAGKPGPPQ
jgi:hypothetical protein